MIVVVESSSEVDQEIINRIRESYEGDGGPRWRRIEEDRPRGYLEQNLVIGRRQLHDQLLAWLIEEPGRSVLDAGCGLGTLTYRMQETGIFATGVDLVPAFIEEARRRTGSDGPTFVVGDLQRLLADEDGPAPFDAVVLTEVLEDYDPEQRHELLKAIAQSGTPRLYLAFRSTGFGSGGLWKRLSVDDDRDISEIELLRAIHLATPFRQRRQAKIRVRNYRAHLSDLRRDG
jgi:2-polyprenyl-3-methyl-5-hydroxy-6-metoxy-1,4-benzoquinol methylase